MSNHYTIKLFLLLSDFDVIKEPRRPTKCYWQIKEPKVHWGTLGMKGFFEASVYLKTFAEFRHERSSKTSFTV